MIGVLLITHDRLGESLLANAERLLGPQLKCRVVTQHRGKSREDLLEATLAALDEVEGRGGVMILTDLYGGTPYNVALDCAKKHPCSLITGVNLPMLIKVLESDRRSIELNDLTEAAVKAGTEGITPYCPRCERIIALENEDQKPVTVLNKLGLHASNSAKLVQQANRFDANIEIRKGNQVVNAKSIMGVLMLAAAQGTELVLVAKGPDAGPALRALGELFENRFGEE